MQQWNVYIRQHQRKFWLMSLRNSNHDSWCLLFINKHKPSFCHISPSLKKLSIAIFPCLVDKPVFFAETTLKILHLPTAHEWQVNLLVLGGAVAKWSKALLLREEMNKNQKIPGSPMAWPNIIKKEKIMNSKTSLLRL